MKPVSTVWQRDEDGILQPVSTRIDFGDYARMGTERHVARRHARWTPAFAANDVQLRKVIAQRLWNFIQGVGIGRNDGSGHVPDELVNDWQRLCRMADEVEEQRARRDISHLSTYQQQLIRTHRESVKRAGGYAELQAAIAYRSWRLGQDSVAVGESLGMSPQSVRVNLQRMSEMARRLGFEVFPYHKSRGVLRILRGNMKRATVVKHIGRLKSLAAKNHGVLPTYSWLNRHGHFGSYDCVRKYASGFLKRIKRARLRRA